MGKFTKSRDFTVAVYAFTAAVFISELFSFIVQISNSTSIRIAASVLIFAWLLFAAIFAAVKKHFIPSLLILALFAVRLFEVLKAMAVI